MCIMLATVETQFDLIGFHNKTQKKLQVYKNVMQINWTKQPKSGQDIGIWVQCRRPAENFTF